MSLIPRVGKWWYGAPGLALDYVGVPALVTPDKARRSSAGPPVRLTSPLWTPPGQAARSGGAAGRVRHGVGTERVRPLEPGREQRLTPGVGHVKSGHTPDSRPGV